MKSKWLTFDYFSKTLLDPLFEVFNVLDNNNHQENKKLRIDLDNIDKVELDEFVKENNIDFYLKSFEYKDIRRRAYCFINKINRDISRVRVEKLIDSVERPAPYNLSNLQDLIIDKNKLASINQFNIDSFGFEKNDLVYTLCPILDQSNSSHWIFQTILKFAKENKLSFKVRLDPFIEIPIGDYHPIFYKMLVYGRQLNWERLRSLKNDDSGRWYDEKSYSRVGNTDYVWSPKDNIVHFTCEELPKLNFKGIKTSRYFHAIFNKDTGGIIHCDGAIRVYSDIELGSRSNFHVKAPEVRKVGKRVKIFQYESNENNWREITADMFCLLAVNFFVWNDDIERYFN